MKKLNLNETEIIKLYTVDKLSLADIAKIYNCSYSTIKKRLIKNNLKIRTSKYSKNEQFFSKGNNAYWAGFIASDGYIGENDNTVAIQINKRDLKLLEEFKKQSKFNGPIQPVRKDGCHRIKICNARNWIKDLKKYWNLKQNKSLTIMPPNVKNKNKIIEYIIGIIDGDGTICMFKSKKRMYFKLSICCASKIFLIWIADQLYKLNNNYTKRNIYKKKNSNLYYIKYDNMQAYEMAEILYNTKTPFKLKRKWLKLNEYKKYRIKKYGQYERLRW